LVGLHLLLLRINVKYLPLKKLFKYTGISLLGVIAFILLYLFSAWGLSRITISREENAPQEVAIYIKTNGVHTDIVVPVCNEQMDWSKEIKFGNTVSKDSGYQYLGMGWGDKGFYLETPAWADLKASVAFKAAFSLSTTAIHATYYAGLKEDQSCRRIMVSKAQYARLVTYILNSFSKDGEGHVRYIATNANYGQTDAFYEANGKYNLFKTCNTWANNGLKACGQKCCLWTAFDTGIFLKYE